MLGSSIIFLFCLGGLYWVDYLERRNPATEEMKRRIADMKNLRLPSRQDWQEARDLVKRHTAEREEKMKDAEGKATPLWKRVE
jgi:hypothetical protein